MPLDNNPAKPAISVRGAVLLCIAVIVISELLGLPVLRMSLAPVNTETDQQPAASAPSLVAWTQSTIASSSNGNPIRGELISRRCEVCHGPEGFSSNAATPNLAGLDNEYVWKQLEDFRSGKRKSPIMQKIASALTSRDSADLAAYFSLLPTMPDAQFSPSFPQQAKDPAAIQTAEELLSVGDPHRGIPPCQACHGPLDYIRAAPSLASQNSDYVLHQLDAFAASERANDINVPMRTIASQLQESERQAVAEFYGSGSG